MSAIGPELPPHLLDRSKGGTPSDGEDEPSTVGPQIPPHLVAGPSNPFPQPSQPEDEDGSDSDGDYAPALPPDLLASRSGSTTKVLGPSFPRPYSKGQNHDRSRYGDDADEDSEDDVGPMPLPDGISFGEENGVREFMEREERRRKQVEVRIC